MKRKEKLLPHEAFIAFLRETLDNPREASVRDMPFWENFRRMKYPPEELGSLIRQLREIQGLPKHEVRNKHFLTVLQINPGNGITILGQYIAELEAELEEHIVSLRA